MTDEVDEEATNDSEEESTPELTLEEHKEALKKSRWNVFMYLGFAALLFGFALYPFMSIPMEVEGGIGSDEETITVWGLPVAGEDFTDIPVEIKAEVFGATLIGSLIKAIKSIPDEPAVLYDGN